MYPCESISDFFDFIYIFATDEFEKLTNTFTVAVKLQNSFTKSLWVNFFILRCAYFTCHRSIMRRSWVAISSYSEPWSINFVVYYHELWWAMTFAVYYHGLSVALNLIINCGTKYLNWVEHNLPRPG